MADKILPNESQCAAQNIFSRTDFTDRVLELTYNSIDAKATCIAVRINFVDSDIEVDDNGDGFSYAAMQQSGTSHVTNKILTTEELNSPPICFGFKGGALADIIKQSKYVKIESTQNCENTYSKTFLSGHGGDVVKCEQRISKGTTVSANGLFYRTPVRRNRNNEIEMQKLIFAMKTLALLFPKIYFTVQDLIYGSMRFRVSPDNIIPERYEQLFIQIPPVSLSLITYELEDIKVKAFIGISLSKNGLQFIYVNNRNVICEKINQMIRDTVGRKLSGGEKYNESNESNNELKTQRDAGVPTFIINLTCPLYKYILLVDSKSRELNIEADSFLLIVIEAVIEKFLNRYRNSHNSDTNVSTQIIEHNEQISTSKDIQDKHPSIKSLADRLSLKGTNFRDLNLKNLVVKVEPLPRNLLKRKRDSDTLSREIVNDEIRIPTVNPINVVPRYINTGDKNSSNITTRSVVNESDNKETRVSKNQISNSLLIASVKGEKKSNEMRSLHSRIEQLRERITSRLTENNMDTQRKRCEGSTLFSNFGFGDHAYSKDPSTYLQNNMVTRANNDFYKGIDLTINKLQSREHSDHSEYGPTLLQSESIKNKTTDILKTNPDILKVNPGIFRANPGILKVNPDIFKANPVIIEVNPDILKTNPDILKANPDILKVNPDILKVNPDIFKANPDILKANPDMLKTNPDILKIIPDIVKANEDIVKANPEILKADPVIKIIPISETKIVEVNRGLGLVAREHDIWMENIDNKGQLFFIDANTGKSSYEFEKLKEIKSFLLENRSVFLPKGSSPKVDNMQEIQELLQKRSLKKKENPDTPASPIKNIFGGLNLANNTNCYEKILISTNKSGQKNLRTDRSLQQILGQLDNKFIICLVNKGIQLATSHAECSKMLVLFDQHSVHERITLEKLLKEYTFSEKNCILHSRKLEHQAIFVLTDIYLFIFKRCPSYLKRAGFRFDLDVAANVARIRYVPACLYNKIRDKPKGQLERYLSDILWEQYNYMLMYKGVRIGIPRTLLDIINSEACRDSIKFGDDLSLDRCHELITELSICQAPFICAHGRSIIIAFADLTRMPVDVIPKSKLPTLRLFKHNEVRRNK